MRSFKNVFFNASLAAGIFALAAPAATIFDTGITSLTASDPTQFGRLSRSGVISDWSSSKAYPGTINGSTVYHYHAYDIPIPAWFPFVQITIDDISGSALVFASAYLGSYSPNNTSPNFGENINYLGDAGGSGNLFGTDPRAFQVIMPTSADLIVLINDSGAANAGVGKVYDLLIEGFSDNSFDETTPEPVTMILTASGLFGLALLRRRKTARA